MGRRNKQPPSFPAGRPAVDLIEIPVEPRHAAVNVYLLPEEPITLIDTGPRSPMALGALRQAMAQRGLELADVRQILVTHTHIAHAGLAGELQREIGADVLVHPAGVATLASFPRVLAEREALVERAARAAAVPAELLDAFIAEGRELESLVGSVSSGAIRPAGDGTSVRAGGTSWTVLHTPGHATDHICLVHPPSGTLFVGDLLGRHAPTWATLEPRRADGQRPPVLAELLQSWRRVGRQHAAIAWTGHGPPVRAHRALLAQRLAGVRSELRTAYRSVEQGAVTIWEVALALGLPADGTQLDRTLGHSVALLDWLVDQNWLNRSVSEGVVRLAKRPAPTSSEAAGQRG